MEDERSITVVVPTWNRAPLIRSLVSRLLAKQTDDEFGLIVVDDGSVDDTLAVLNEVDDHRLTVLARSHRGVCEARNAGAARSGANWLIFLDSDDTPDSDWIASFRALMTSDSDLVSVGQRRHLPDGSQLAIRPRKLGAAFSGLPILWQAGAFSIRRNLFNRLGGYQAGLAFSENTDLAFRAARQNDLTPLVCSVDPAPHYSAFIRSGRYDPAIRLESALDILRDHGDRLRMQPELLASYEAMAGVASQRLGDRRGAIPHLRRAVRARPLDLRHSARLIVATVRRPTSPRV